MFQSYAETILSPPRVSYYAPQIHIKFKIIDDDFVATSIVWGFTMEVFEITIGIYEWRKLPVIPNLLRVMNYHASHTHWTMQRLAEWNKKNNPKFAKYKDEVDRYLVLL